MFHFEHTAIWTSRVFTVRNTNIGMLSRWKKVSPDNKSFVWESHVRQQIFVVFEDFYRQKKQNPA